MRISDEWPNWKKGDIIRHITTGRPMRVLHIFAGPLKRETTTLLVPMDATDQLPPSYVLQQRCYEEWVRDIELDVIEDTEEVVEYKIDKVKF